MSQRKVNQYDLSLEYGIGYTNKGIPFYFDKEDYHKIVGYTWHMDANGFIVCKRDKTYKTPSNEIYQC